MSFDNLIKNIIKKAFDIDKCESAIRDEVQKSDRKRYVDVIAEDYYQLIKSVLKLREINDVQLNCEDILTITIDGTEYCFDGLVRHNDLKNTERIMEIEALFADGLSCDEVQSCLNQKVRSRQSNGR